MRRTRTASGVFAVLALATIAIVFGAPACRGDDVLFSDDFKTADPCWGTNTQVSIKDGAMTVTSDANTSQTELHEGWVFQDMTCSVNLQKVSGDSGDVAGIAFWATDYNNYYIAQISSNGYVSVCRIVNNGNWMYPVSGRACADIKQGVGQANLLTVTIRGAQVTVSVNGKDAVSFKGQAPDGGGEIGTAVSAGNQTKSVWTFTNVKVTK